MVSEAYTKTWRAVSYTLTLLICVPLARYNLVLLLFAPVILFFMSMFASIIGKRMFPPHVEDVAALANKAKYIAL